MRFNFNPVWMSNHTPGKVRDEITYQTQNLNSSLESKSNFIAHFVMDVITYPCWD